MDWKTWLENRYTRATAAAYAREIELFLQRMPDAENADYGAVLEYLTHLREQHRPASVKRHLQSLKKYYKYLQSNALREDNPTAAVLLKDGGRHRERPLQELLSLAQLEALRDALQAKKYRYKSKRTRFLALFDLLIFQALTTEELCALRPDDLDLEGGKIRVAETQNTMGRTLPLMSVQILPLQELCANADEYLFAGLTADNLHYLVSSLRVDFLKDKRLSPLRLRQSVIASKFEQGWDLRRVQLFAGHRYPSSTEAYRINGLESLIRAVERCHPLG